MLRDEVAELEMHLKNRGLTMDQRCYVLVKLLARYSCHDKALVSMLVGEIKKYQRRHDPSVV